MIDELGQKSSQNTLPKMCYVTLRYVIMSFANYIVLCNLVWAHTL